MALRRSVFSTVALVVLAVIVALALASLPPRKVLIQDAETYDSSRHVANTDENVFNFGTIRQGTEVERVFHVHNDTDMPRHLDRVLADCACSIVTFDKREIPKGGSSAFVVRMKSAGMRGFQEKRFAAFLSGRPSPIEFCLKGLVDDEERATPPLVDFGLSESGVENSRLVEIALFSGDSKIGRIDSSSPLVGAEIWDYPSLGKARVRIHAKTTDRVGGINEQVKIYVPDRQRPIVIPVICKSREPLRVEPSALYLGRFDGSKELSGEVKILHARSLFIEHVNCQSSSEDLVISVHESAEGEFSIRVKLHAPETPEFVTRSGRISILLHGEERPRELSFQVTALMLKGLEAK